MKSYDCIDFDFTADFLFYCCFLHALHVLCAAVLSCFVLWNASLVVSVDQLPFGQEGRFFYDYAH